MCDLTRGAAVVGPARRTMLAAATGTAATAWATSAAAASGHSDRTDHGHRVFRPGRRTRAVLLGTAGGPPWWPDSTRQGCASALVVGDRYYLVDVGHGVGPQLRAARLGDWESFGGGPLDALRAVFLTHHHSDHTIDLANIIIEGVAANGLHRVDRPVQVWGPGDRGALPPLAGPPPAPQVTAPENPTPGTREMVDLLIRAYAADLNDRVFDTRKPPPADLVVGRDVPIPSDYTADPNGNPHPRMSPVRVYEDDRVRVSATLVQHAPTFPALAYRFDSDDGAVVFSGDTGPSENLIELARGADLLVHEVIAREWVEGLFPEPRTSQDEAIVRHLIEAHTTIEEVGGVADRAGVSVLALNHLVPGNWPEREFQKAQRHFSGRLIVGRDLDEIGVGKRRSQR